MAEGVTGRVAGPVNLGSLAYTALSDMIRHRRLRAGDAIVEARLAETLGVSRTPLREALQRLEAEAMVVRAGRSFVVRRVDLGEYLKSLKVRSVLEPEAAALAVGRVPGVQLAAVRGLKGLRATTRLFEIDRLKERLSRTRASISPSSTPSWRGTRAPRGAPSRSTQSLVDFAIDAVR